MCDWTEASKTRRRSSVENSISPLEVMGLSPLWFSGLKELSP